MRSHALRAAAGGERKYRFLRLTVEGTRVNTSTLYDLRYSEDGGTTWVPSANMTGASAPSPLVASASTNNGAGFEAWRAFDSNTSSSNWTSAVSFATGSYITLDLGAGNEILPNALKWINFNTAGIDRTPMGLTLDGSNTGSFSGEEDQLYTVTGLASSAHLAVVTKTW